MRTASGSENDREPMFEVIAGQRASAAMALVTCFLFVGFLLLDACVGETPSDCLSHVNCIAPTDAGADASVHLDAARRAGDVEPQNDGPGSDAESRGEVQDAPIDTWDGFDGFTCDPGKAPHDQPCVIDEAYGVFVAPVSNGGSDTAGEGSRAKPYATIEHALQSLGGKARVYVCDGKYAERVTLSSAVSLYGGLLCPNDDAGPAWSYVGGQAQIIGPQNEIALTVSGVTSAVSIEDMSFSAPNASGQDPRGDGFSSIAALVNASTLALRRCALTAGRGDNGHDGALGTNYSGMTAPQGGANDGGVGGPGGTINCNDGTSAAGGNGGSATATIGTDGGNGRAIPTPQTYPAMRLDGLGGAGGFACTPGDRGASGAAGAAGAAARAYGALTTSGWTPSSADNGHAGFPGLGGGGGGGVAGATPLGGAGGGAGGCGGAGGTGGRGGGASIALACIGSAVALEACTLTASNGGNGGNGGDGQPGQGGALAGPVGSLGNCGGGLGGNGAGGSAGAGGTGGSSLCIAYAGSLPSGTPSCTNGDAGQPGIGGTGGEGGSNALGSGPAGDDGGAGFGGLAAGQLQMQ